MCYNYKQKERIIMAITPKDAVKSAAEYLRELLPVVEGTEITVEEIEKTPDGKFWKVTLGYSKEVPKNSLEFLLGVNAKKFKEVTVDAKTGESVAMKSPELSGR
jgi:hypothetical protein